MHTARCGVGCVAQCFHILIRCAIFPAHPCVHQLARSSNFLLEGFPGGLLTYAWLIKSLPLVIELNLWPLSPPQRWGEGGKFQLYNDGWFFWWLFPILKLSSYPGAQPGVTSLAYKRHSYRLGDSKGLKSSVPGTGDKGQIFIFYYITPVFSSGLQ